MIWIGYSRYPRQRSSVGNRQLYPWGRSSDAWRIPTAVASALNICSLTIVISVIGSVSVLRRPALCSSPRWINDSYLNVSYAPTDLKSSWPGSGRRRSALDWRAVKCSSLPSRASLTCAVVKGWRASSSACPTGKRVSCDLWSIIILTPLRSIS